MNWILDAGIRSFFDQMSHEWVMKFVQNRVADPRLLRMIQKWLKAGVSEDGEWSETTVGTPRGAVISPLPANLYPHYVFDLWLEAWRKKVAEGEYSPVPHLSYCNASLEWVGIGKAQSARTSTALLLFQALLE